MYYRRILFSLLSVLLTVGLYANEVVSEMRKGNRAIKKNNFGEAELYYRKAKDITPADPKVQYNLANALYLQVDSTNIESEESKKRLVSAANYLKQSGEVFATPKHKEAAYFNLGNTHLKQGDLDNAIEAYKQSLRMNPNNMETKENLYYAQLMKQQQENQDQNKDKNKDQDQKDKDKDNKDEQQDKNDQQKSPENQDKENQNQQNQPQNMSKEDAQRILEAMQQQENQTKENLEKQKGVPLRARSGKNW